MRLRIDCNLSKRILIVGLLMVSVLPMRAGWVVMNPGEWMALAEGNDLINKQIQNQTKGQLQTAALQNTMAAEYNQIQKWERKYSGYLQTASGYASTLKAGTTLYHDGVHIFITLGQLKKAIENNPQGIVASMSMNNLYIETATELVSVFTILKEGIASGGQHNMLTGAERSQMLWTLQDKLSDFSKKLRQFYLSVRYYTMTDVWNNATAGMVDRDHAEVASIALERWRRSARVVSQY